MLNKINYLNLKFGLAEPVDPGYSPRTDTVDFDQFISDYINAHKIQAIGDQPIFDNPADLLFLRE